MPLLHLQNIMHPQLLNIVEMAVAYFRPITST